MEKQKNKLHYSSRFIQSNRKFILHMEHPQGISITKI